MGILVNTGFDVGSSNPIDSRTVKNTTNERDALVTDGLVYENLKVYCKDTQTEYRWTGTDWEEVGTGGTGGTVDLSGYAKTYTSLTELGLTADATVEDVVSALKNGESFLAPVNTFTNYETIFPNKVPSDQWNKIHIIKGTSLPNSHIRCFSQSGACEYLANVNNTNITGWNDVSGTYIDISDSIIEKLGTEILKYPVGKYRINSNATGNKFTDLPSDAESKCGTIEVNGTAVGKSPFTDAWVYRMYKFECLTGTSSYVRRLDSGATAGQIEHDTGWRKVGQEIYTSLADLGLDTTATINDIVAAMKDGTTFTYKTDVFDYATEYNNIQLGTVTIDKQGTGRFQVLMTDKNTGNLYVGRMDTNNLFVGWRSCTFHRVVAQATAGYFKFKPTSDGGFEQPLRISATDNYGGMIEISGNAPTQTQYKPFKCVRLSHGTYTDYNASNPANNKMEKLFFLDGYMYLKIASYTTTTFTGLVGAPTFVETIDETAAVEIPIVSIIATQYDAYGDPYIVTIGETVSSDGSIQTLASLGLSTDIMTWKTGIYKVSHVSGLTGLPSDIINTSPGFRLEHHNIKKWGGGHAPYKDTWAQRHSVIYCDNGNVYHRFYESGATAGHIVNDTGWRKNVDDTRVTTLETQVDELFQSVSSGKTAVANAITGKGVSTSTTATFATMATNVGKITNYTASEKQALATAITNKGVSTSSTASFSTMATNISKIKGYKEETKSSPVPLSGSTTITSTFSADVIGIKQIILPTDSSRVLPQTTLESFKIEGKNVTMTITGSGTWKVTALIEA